MSGTSNRWQILHFDKTGATPKDIIQPVFGFREKANPWQGPNFNG